MEELCIQQGEEVKPFTQLDFVNWRNYDMDASRVFTNLDENTYALVYNWDPIHENVVALRMMPEPATTTLSLLALAALAARRRKHNLFTILVDFWEKMRSRTWTARPRARPTREYCLQGAGIAW